MTKAPAPCATDEEVASVIEYWQKLRGYVYSAERAGTAAGLVQPKISDELVRRVAVHQQWQRASVCEHTSGVVFSVGDKPICSDCDRPMRFLSDVQIENIREDR